jgi:pimeloyl-ACP methyl ester carboxylesterase
MWRVSILLVAAISITAFAQATPQPMAPHTWRIPLTPCKAVDGRVDAMCGRYEVFEDRLAGSGRKIKLNLMVLPATDEKHEPDPVFLIDGGPGDSAVQDLPEFGELFRTKRDVVLIDQRGAGGSNHLGCDFNSGLATSFARIVPLDRVKPCVKELEKIADLRFYTTSIAMDDLDEVRAALGYDRINVWGGSYGSTAALDYLRRHGNHVRTITVEGVIPTGYRAPLPFPSTIQRSMEGVFDRCATDEKCRAAFPRLRDEFQAVLGRLGKAPVIFTFTTGPASMKEPVEITLTRDMFTDFLRRILYSPLAIAMVPSAIHSAYDGDFEPYALLCYRLSIRPNQDSVAFGLYHSIICSESVPFITDEEVVLATEKTWVGDSRIRIQREVCSAWPRATVPRSFIDLVRSDKPVLLISGDLDPAAQPEYAAAAATYLTNSRHVVVHNASHSLSSTCTSGPVVQFIDSGSAEGLDTSCVDKIKLPPFKLLEPKAITVPQKILRDYVGTYEVTPTFSVAITLEGGNLMEQATGQDKLPIFAESDTKFFLKAVDAQVEFFKNEKGEVTHLVVHAYGRDTKGMRR